MSDIKQSRVETFQRCFTQNPGKYCTLIDTLHWLIYGTGAFGFWFLENAPWMWPWAADCSGANATSVSISAK